MPKYFPVVKKKTVIVEVPVGDGSEVQGERLQYDNRTIAKKAEDGVEVDVVASEVAKRAIDTVTAALAAEVFEANEKSVESVSTELNVSEEAQRADDIVATVASVSELNQKADDTIQTIIIPTADQAKKAVEDVSNEVSTLISDQAKRAFDTNSVDVESFETAKKADDTISFETEFYEVAKRAVEDVSNVVTGIINDIGKRASDSITSAIIPTTDLNQKSDDTQTIEITLNGYANSVASNSGFSNPNNSLGNTTGTAATLTATSSGLLGTTNNTSNGTIILDFRDINLGDIDITSAILSVENGHANAGLPLVQPTCNIQFQYSTDGSNYTTFYTLTGQTGKGVRTIDLTSILAANKALLNSFRVRATGSVTSGTGLGAGSTASFYRAWLTILGNKVYV